jgi:hypothetical protein
VAALPVAGKTGQTRLSPLPTPDNPSRAHPTTAPLLTPVLKSRLIPPHSAGPAKPLARHEGLETQQNTAEHSKQRQRHNAAHRPPPPKSMAATPTWPLMGQYILRGDGEMAQGTPALLVLPCLPPQDSRPPCRDTPGR